jgi:hypothetical protein
MPPKKENTRKTEETNIISTLKVQEIIEKEKLALPLKRTERLWFNSNEGVRRKGIKFAMTPDEIEEYIKCKLSVYYFAEHYCKIKLEDGTVGQMKLREYQKDIIKLYTENRYSILMASRQVGKCIDYRSVLTVRDDNTGYAYKISIGKLYYNTLSKYRELTFLEKTKKILYYLLEKLD